MAVYKLPLVLEPQPEGGYTVTSPVLPELVTEGDSVEEAIRNADDALEALVEAFRHPGRLLPQSLGAVGEAGSFLPPRRGDGM